MEAKRNSIIVILGKKWSGKSYLANKIAGRLVAAGRRVIALDPSDCFDFPAVRLTDPDPDDLAGLDGRSCIIKPTMDRTGHMIIDFVLELGKISLHDHYRPFWFVCDEIDFYFGPHIYSDSMLQIVRYGRHYGISLMAVCQRPASVNKNLLSQADQKIMFHISEPNDLAYLHKWAGADPDRLRSLSDRKFIVLK